MKKYNDEVNILGKFLEKRRKEINLSKEEVSRQLQLHGVYLNRVELYRIENQKMILKDFELIALAIVLKINLEDLKNLIE